MTEVLITTYYHYGIEKETKQFDSYEEAYSWIKEKYPNAEENWDLSFKDYDSDSTIEFL